MRADLQMIANSSESTASCTEKNESACRDRLQEFTPGLHMHLAADNFVYVNDKLWSLNVAGIRRGNSILRPVPPAA